MDLRAVLSVTVSSSYHTLAPPGCNLRYLYQRSRKRNAVRRRIGDLASLLAFSRGVSRQKGPKEPEQANKINKRDDDLGRRLSLA
jgi:hypothetical protein